MYVFSKVGQRVSVGTCDVDSGGVVVVHVCQVVRSLVMESYGGEEKGFQIYTV